MAIGTRKPIQFQIPVISDEVGGAQSETFINGVRTWAVCSQTSSNSTFGSGQRTMVIVYKFSEVRVPAVSPVNTWRILFEGKTLVIDTIIKVGSNPDYYTITATDLLHGEPV